MVPRSAEDICNLALLRAGINEKIVSLTGDQTRTSDAAQTAYDENRRVLIMDLLPAWAKKRAQLTPYSGNAYDAGHAYAAGDLAALGNFVYRSLQAGNTNNQPDLLSSAAWWAQVTRDGWSFACPLPSDCLDPRQIWERPTVSPFATTSIFAGLANRDDAFNLRNPLSDDRVPYAIEDANDGTDNIVLLTDVDTPVLLYVADVTNPSAFPSPFVQALAWMTGADLAMGLRGDEKKFELCQKMVILSSGKAYTIDRRDQQEDPVEVSEFEAARRGLT